MVGNVIFGWEGGVEGIIKAPENGHLTVTSPGLRYVGVRCVARVSRDGIGRGCRLCPLRRRELHRNGLRR